MISKRGFLFLSLLIENVPHTWIDAFVQTWTKQFRNCLLLYHKIVLGWSVTQQLLGPDVTSRTACAWNQGLHKQKSSRPESGSFVSKCHMIKGRSVQALTVTSLLCRGLSFCLQTTVEFGDKRPEDFSRVQQLRHCLSTPSDFRVTKTQTSHNTVQIT